MAAMRFEQVQRFILAKKTFWGYGHFKPTLTRTPPTSTFAKSRFKADFETCDYINELDRYHASLCLSGFKVTVLVCSNHTFLAAVLMTG